MSETKDYHSELSTTSSLINDLQGFSDERWRRFVLVYSPLFRYWIKRKTVQDGHVEDILQESFVSVKQGITDFERGKKHGTFRGWLKTIVVRRVADHHRQTTLEKNYDNHILDSKPSEEQLLELTSEQEELPSLIDLEARAFVLLQGSVSEKTWQIFRMSVIEKVPTAEIAQKLGISNAGVRVAKGRVLKKLRDLLLDQL